MAILVPGSGGLTPYVIDATFADEEEPAPAPPVAESAGAVWEVRLDQGWAAFDDYAQALLRSAKAAGLPRSEVTSAGRSYDARLQRCGSLGWAEEVDFKQMCQISAETGKMRQVRERMLVEPAAPKGKEGEMRSENPRASRSSRKAASAMQAPC